MNTPRPYRKTRSLARAVRQTDKARELHHTATESEPAAWHLLRRLKSLGRTVLRMSNVIVEEVPQLFVQKVLDAVWSLPEAVG